MVACVGLNYSAFGSGCPAEGRRNLGAHFHHLRHAGASLRSRPAATSRRGDRQSGRADSNRWPPAPKPDSDDLPESRNRRETTCDRRLDRGAVTLGDLLADVEAR